MFTRYFLKMLNREAMEMSQEIIGSLKIQEGYVIADIGAGGGYYSLEFARKVGKRGKVYAVDVKLKYLEFIRYQAEKEHISNIIFVLSKGKHVDLPKADVDIVFCRNVFHHLKEPADFFYHIKRFLKPCGKVAIIDYKPRYGINFINLFRHYTPEKIILREMYKAGYFWIESFNFLPKESFNLFSLR